MRSRLTICLVLYLFVSCKKVRIEGESAILVGEWELVDVYNVFRHPNGELMTLDVEIEEQLKLEIKSKGVIRLSDGDKCLKRSAITNVTISQQPTGPLYKVDCPNLEPFLKDGAEQILLRFDGDLLVCQRLDFAESSSDSHLYFEYYFQRD